VTLERLDYEDTTGIWQVISYQMITDEEAVEITERLPEYVPGVLDDSTDNTNPADRIIEAEGSCAVIYNANKKDHIVTLTEQESRQIKEIFEKYPEENSITASGLQDMVIKYEDVMYAFSTEGYVLVMDGSEISTPRAQIVLSSEDLETLLNIFSKYGI
jgi:preprotein translocase subunit SecA